MHIPVDLFDFLRCSYSHCPGVFQVGIIGENEEWLLVHQLSNEPDARSLEVLDLNPYTFYR